MNEILRPVIDEAIRELNISDRPDFYHRLRRWARRYLKHQAVEPIDTIDWQKGILLVGLMHQAQELSASDSSADRALSIKIIAEVKDHLDAWIGQGSPIYKIDDCLAGQALLMLMESLDSDNEKDSDGVDIAGYKDVATKIMQYLYDAPKDSEGALPYRPNQKNGRIFADGIGMAAPFAIKYGIMFDDDEAIQLGMDQIDAFMKNGMDPETGLPWHAYSLAVKKSIPESINGCKEEKCITGGESIAEAGGPADHIGDLGWGRGTGWIMYGLGASLETLLNLEGAQGVALADNTAAATDTDKTGINKLANVSPLVVTSRKKIAVYIRQMSSVLTEHIRPNGLFGCQLTDPGAPIDTSATAMILYGLGAAHRTKENIGGQATEYEHEYEHESERESDPVSDDFMVGQSIENTMGKGVDRLSEYVTPDGHVTQAQGECIDFGIYGDFGSYPWSVGGILLLNGGRNDHN